MGQCVFAEFVANLRAFAAGRIQEEEFRRLTTLLLKGNEDLIKELTALLAKLNMLSDRAGALVMAAVMQVWKPVKQTKYKIANWIEN